MRCMDHSTIPAWAATIAPMDRSSAQGAARRAMLCVHEIVARLLVATALSGAIGLQRSLSGQTAGMRTHIVVGVGAALFTLASAYAFNATTSSSDRTAAQVVSGIGFIGGGAILKERGSIRGLTTAAGVWTAAALGMTAAAGLFVMGCVGVAIVLVALVGLRYVELRFPRRSLQHWQVRCSVADHREVEGLRTALAPHCRDVTLISLQDDATSQVTFSIEIARNVDITALIPPLKESGRAGSPS